MKVIICHILYTLYWIIIHSDKEIKSCNDQYNTNNNFVDIFIINLALLQERTNSNVYDHNGLNLHYKLDNEFDLVFVVAYQKILQLSYVDKFLNDIHLEFRDKYKNDLADGRYLKEFNFQDSFNVILQSAEDWSKTQLKLPKQMRTFDESVKSKKTVASMIEKKSNEKPKEIKKKEVVFAEGNKISLCI